LTLVEMVVAVGLAAVVVVIAATLYMAVLGTERLSREVLGSAPEAGLVELLEDLSSCVTPPSVWVRDVGGVRWWRTDVCVRAHALDVRRSTIQGIYMLRLRSAADRAAVEQLWPLAAGSRGGEVWVRTGGGCVCALVTDVPIWGDPEELRVWKCGACVPAPGPVEAEPFTVGRPPGPRPGPGVLRAMAEVVVVPPGAGLPRGAPPQISPQGLSLLFGWYSESDPPPPDDPFPENVLWSGVYAHLPSGTLDAARTWEAWGSRHLVTGPVPGLGDLPGGGGLTTADLDGNGDGELGPGETPVRRLVPMSALEGWVLWTTRAGTLRKQVPVRCGVLEIPVGDRRECTVRSFRPF
jgi:hypothetical protein